ncbi:hypothetical protein C8Q78DRAFT_1072796 [Trametes maxima]|nr:hypothetical protein C8Q78DRAFT_1072796 [Trametes maxima]
MAEMFRKWEAEDELEEARKRVQVTEEGGEIGEGHTEVDKAQKLDDYIHPSGVFSSEDGWRESAVEIPLPKPKVSHTSEAAAPTFTVKGIHHRGLMDIIRGIFEGEEFAKEYHWTPHKTFWQPIHIYTNTYDSDAAREAHETLQQQQRDPNDTPEVPYIIFPLMIGSDATHLTSFGAAATWPFYLYSGALSKYVRGMPSKFTAQHLAYIPSLPDTIQDAYLKAYGTAASADVLTFCKHELMQCVWLLLLDEEFMDTYKNGILVVCGDGVTCRIFPPFHDLLGRLPGKTDSKQQQRDIKKARKLIFEDGRSLASRRVKDLLDARSLNPIQPAFSVQLSPFGVNVYDLFAPDLMHEFELGVWKGTFTHLLRLVAAQGDDMLKEFNRRFVIISYLFLLGVHTDGY